MTYALFLGCTIPARSRNYEASARRVAQKVGLTLVDLPEFVCCGFPIKNMDQAAAGILAGYNLALASARGLDLCTLCSSCTSALTEVSHHLQETEAAREAMNRRLVPAGVAMGRPVRVRHLARILYEEIGPATIAEHVEKRLRGLKIAIHYGCHYLKPSDVFGGFDDPEDPRSIDALVSLTGAEVVEYSGKKRCCGGPVLPVDQEVALEVTRGKLDAVKAAGAEALCVVCPFCSVMYDGNQKSLASEAPYDLPVLYLTQLLGVAMGFDRKALGLNMNVVKTKGLLSRFYE